MNWFRLMNVLLFLFADISRNSRISGVLIMTHELSMAQIYIEGMWFQCRLKRSFGETNLFDPLRVTQQIY